MKGNFKLQFLSKNNKNNNQNISFLIFNDHVGGGISYQQILQVREIVDENRIVVI